VERLRAQLLTALAIRAQDTAEMVSLAFDQIVYRGHPYSRPEDGYPETIQAITQADLVDFHRRCYGPRGMVLDPALSKRSRRSRRRTAAGDNNPSSRHRPPCRRTP
jgi:zinc protease